MVLLMVGWTGSAQEMTIAKMDSVIQSVADSVVFVDGNWHFKYQESYMMIMTDVKYNRMRIITPIVDQESLDEVELTKLMEANYHSALDTKYALSDGILWGVFIHPLRELSKNQFVNAIHQVYSTYMTYGTTYTSTGLQFGGEIRNENPSKKN